MHLEVRAIQAIQSSGTVLPTPQNIAREATKQRKHEVKSKPETPADVTISHDHLPDTPLNDSRLQSVGAQVQPAKVQSPQSQKGKSSDVSMRSKKIGAVTQTTSTDIRRSIPANPLLLEASTRRLQGLSYLTPLQIAIQARDIEEIRALITEGADVNELSGNRDPVLLTACTRDGHPEIITILIAAGADVNGLDRNGCTALYMACKNGHMELVAMLIQAGADLNGGLSLIHI